MVVLKLTDRVSERSELLLNGGKLIGHKNK